MADRPPIVSTEIPELGMRIEAERRLRRDALHRIAAGLDSARSMHDIYGLRKLATDLIAESRARQDAWEKENNLEGYRREAARLRAVAEWLDRQGI